MTELILLIMAVITLYVSGMVLASMFLHAISSKQDRAANRGRMLLFVCLWPVVLVLIAWSFVDEAYNRGR